LGDDGGEKRGPSIQINSPASSENTKKHPAITVLYVDDEPALLDPIRHYLERKGNFSVETITSAKSALDLIRKKRYDVIVSDYQMPGMDGIQLLKHLRDEKNPIPFIIFTGKGHEDVVVDAYNAGADFYIPKGGNPKAMFLDLTQKITQIVTRRRSEEALFESEERYRKVVEQSHDAIFIYQQSRLVFVNDQVPKISGYTKAELYTMEIWTIIHPEDREFLKNIAGKQDLGSTVSKTYEARIITKTGEIRYLEIAITPLAFNGIDSALGSARDITERKSSEEALRKSEEKYRSIFNTFDDLYYQTDMKGTITTLSPSCKKITGWDASELIGLPVTDLYPFPEQRKMLLDHMFKNGEVHDYEVILRNKKGEHLNVSVTSHVVRNEAGEPVAIEGALRNITERIRFENALHESEVRYRSLADFLPVMVFETDPDGMLTFGNRLILPVFGIDPDSLKTDINVLEYIVPEEREMARENIKKMYAEEPRSSNEYTLVRRDGTTFPTMITASAIRDEKTGAPLGMRGVIIDLTERKEAEKALRDSEELFRTLFNNANDAIFLHEMRPDHKPGQYIMVNDIACSRLGYTREELLAMSPFDIVSTAHSRHMAAIAEDIQRKGRSTFDAVHRKKDGSEFPVEINTHLFEMHGRNVSLSIARDITERKQMEDAVRSSEQRLHAIIDGSAIPLFVINRHHEVIYWNRALSRYTKIAEADIQGTADTWKAFYDTPRPVLADILIDDNLPALDEYYQGKWTESKHTKGAYAATDFFPKIGKNGTWLHFTAVVIRDGQGEIIGALETLEDVTEQRKAEEELIAGETYLKTIFNSVQTALVIIDPDTHRIFDLNPAAEKLIGAGREDLIGTPCQQGICPAKEGRCPITDLNLCFENTEQLILTKQGTKIPVTKTIVAVTITGKRYLLENILDITDRKLAEDAMQKAYFELEQKVDERTAELSRLTASLRNEIAERNRVMDALRESEEKYRSLVEQTNDLIFHIDKKGMITYVSPNVVTILGLSDTEVIGKSPTVFMPEDSRTAFVRLHEHNILHKTAVSGIELTLFDTTGKGHILEINGTPHFDDEGIFIGFSGIARDITYRKALQDEIAASLNEKEILLKEIHHRVKNNMQVISSLLSLQAKMVKDEKSRDAIKESQNRVMSIALVHEKLYKSKSLARIDYSEYIRKMAENLLDSYNVRREKAELVVEAVDIVLPISKAIPVSLIINELLSNSLKYAFPDDRKGTVGIVFKKEGDRHFLTVWDNGVGLPPGFRWDEAETLGLQLVSSLVGQLGGEISYKGDNGTEFKITFTVEASAGDHYD
jgi:PAS domain S-box-containing protein